ncbi:hypothetical protein OIU76_020230 [Salix suchowensis]|nr:hypothetical protein OIU76_020230 [Salix suchowensis]
MQFSFIILGSISTKGTKLKFPEIIHVKTPALSKPFSIYLVAAPIIHHASPKLWGKICPPSSSSLPPARSPPPQTVNHAPPPAHAQGSGGGSILGGIGSTIAQGMAFGTGSAVAHRAVDAVMGPRTIQHETSVSEAAAAAAPTASSMGGADACNIHTKAFQDCVNNFGNDISKCQFYMDMLTECRRNSGSMLGA